MVAVNGTPVYHGLPPEDLIGEAEARLAQLKRLCGEHEKLEAANAKRHVEIASLESAVLALRGAL